MSPSPDPPGQSGGINISGTVGPVAGDFVGRDKITYGQTAEETAEALVAVLEKKGGLLTAETAGLQRQTIIKLAQRLKPNEGLDFEQAVKELEHTVEIALELIKRGEQGNAVLAQVAGKTRVGDFDGGASTINQGLADLDASYRRQRVALLEEGVKVDILRRDAVAVARRIETLVAVDHPNERPTWLPAFRERFDAFREEGEAKGINFSLLVAIELAQRMLATAQDSTERGTAGNLLGAALGILGERESGTEKLEQAVVTLREALQEWTRERVPLDWATAQNNLGNALQALGKRESGTARLEAAVAAYQVALQERTRERVPLDWAETLNNLGNALAALGHWERGTARLEAAVAAYRAALQERTRERVPRDWALTQRNLGSTPRILGERESGTARLEEAVAAFREVLHEYTRKRVPFEWAATQNNLGNALIALSQREGGTARLKEAVAAYRKVLQEWTRERVPLLWAMTQNNLGSALRILGERESGTARLEEALVAFREALKERTHERGPRQWALTQRNLGAALVALGERESRKERLEQAVATLDAALAVFTSEGASHYVMMCQDDRQRALELLDKLQGK